MHSVAIKPIIYAGLVLKFFNKIKFVAAMGGVDIFLPRIVLRPECEAW